MSVRSSNYRHIVVTAAKRDHWYEALKCATGSGDANLVDASGRFLGYVDTSGGGSCLSVLPLTSVGKNHIPISAATYQLPLVRAHGSAITALAFSPFDDCTVATASESGQVRVWEVPEDGLSGDLSSPSVSLTGETKRVHALKWHPSASGILAAATAKTVRVWDAAASAEVTAFDETLFAGPVMGAAWNPDGSRLWVVSKGDKKLRLLDPRAGTVAGETEAHEGTRGMGVVSCGASRDLVLTSGFTAKHEREVRVWDPRKLEKRVAKAALGVSTAPIIPLFDADTSLLFLASRGETGLRSYELDEAGKLQSIGNHTALGEPHSGVCLLPKRCLDVLGCEVARVLRLTKTSILPVYVTVPRRVKNKFMPELFPDTASPEPAATGDEWRGGADSAPRRMSVDPADGHLTPIGTSAAVRLSTLDRVATSAGVGVPRLPPPPAGDGAAAGAGAAAAVGEGAGAGEGGADGDGDADGKGEESAAEVARERHFEEVASTFSKSSKYKHVHTAAPPKHRTFFNLQPNVSNTEEVPVAGSAKFLAVAVKGAGGPVVVHRLDAPGKISSTPPVISGHSGPVSALAFSPQHSDLLVTGSDDQHCRVWRVPEGGVTESIDASGGGSEACLGDLTGHAKGVTALRFHPYVSNLLASASADNTVRLWDVDAATQCQSIDVHPDAVTDLSWSSLGAMMATACRDTVVRVVDARASGGAAVAHEVTPFKSTRPPRVTWLGCSTRLFTTGFSANRTRRYKIWDLRSLAKPVVNVEVDRSSSQLLPMFDEDTGLVYMAARGERNIRVVDVGAAWEPPSGDAGAGGGDDDVAAKPCTTLETGADPLLGFALLPKRTCNVRDVEVGRVLQLATSAASVLSVKVPRAAALKKWFQDDLFPPAATGEPSLTIERWAAGDTASASRASLQPEGMLPVSEKPPEEKKVSTTAKVLAATQKSMTEAEHREAMLNRMQAMAAKQAATAGDADKSDSELSGWSDSD